MDYSNARYGDATADLAVLLGTSTSVKISHQQIDFLLRFVYYETLSGTLKRLGVSSKIIPDYAMLKSEYKKQKLYGYLVGAMDLIENPRENNNSPIKKKNSSFQSKLIDNLIIGGDTNAKEFVNGHQNDPMENLKFLVKETLNLN